MLKTFYKKLITVLLAAMLLMSVLPLSASAAVSTTINGVSVTTTGSDDTYVENTSVTAQATTTESCGKYTSSTNTVTIKNTSGFGATVSFKYTLTLNGGTVTINGTSVTATSTYSTTLDNNGTLTVSITSSSSAANTTKVVFSNFSIVLTEDPERTITANGAVGGTAKYGSTTLSAGQTATLTATFNNGIVLVATPFSGYEFAYWKDGNENILSTAEKYTLKPTADMTVTPVFTSGGVFQVGSNIYLSLTEAISAASSGSNKTIIPFKNCTVPAGNYTIPNGVTLLVPFDSDNTSYTTEPAVVYNSYTTPSAYRILTLADGASITVANGGKICVPSKLSSKGQFGGTNGVPTGPHGRIHMNEGSAITLQSGAGLYCYGYISGSGNVVAESGSAVYECFQVRNFRGGTITSNIKNGTVFVFNQYYIQNIEAPLTIKYGATETVFAAINVSSTVYHTTGTFIGSSGLFAPTDSNSSITKRYDGATDRVIFDVEGNASLKSMTLSLSVVTINTANYVLPIANNFTINVNSGTTTVESDVAFITGSKISIANGAQATIKSGADVYVYDSDDWGYYAGSNTKMYPVSYSTVNGTKAVRNNDSLTDVTFDINGALNIAGAFYTTTGGADITSSNKTGVINFNAAAGTATTTQQIENQSDTVDVAITAAQLHNGDGSYTATAGAASGDKFTYDYSLDKWIKGNAYDVNLDGSTSFDDVSTIVNYVLGGASLSDSQLARADVDGDEVIDAFDAAAFDFNYLSSGLIGDVDQDGDVDLIDYQLVTAHISDVDSDASHPANLMDSSYLNQSQYSSLISSYGSGNIVTLPYYAADVQKDKSVDAFDLFRIDKILNNIA